MTDEAPTPGTNDWYDLASIRADWRDAPSVDNTLTQVLAAAQQSVLGFDNGFNWRLDPANDGTDFTAYVAGSVPANLIMAQRMQAVNLWNASRVDPSNGQAGDDTFTLRPFPLDWVVKQIIRPAKPFGSFG